MQKYTKYTANTARKRCLIFAYLYDKYHFPMQKNKLFSAYNAGRMTTFSRLFVDYNSVLGYIEITENKPQKITGGN